MQAEIIDTFKDTVQCSVCKYYVQKSNWKYHKKDHKYSEEGHIKLIDSKRMVI